MGFNLKETSDTATFPIFQKVLETVRGGLTLDITGLTAGDAIEAGTPITFDEATRLAKPADPIGVGGTTSDAKGLLYEGVVVPDSADQVAAVDVVVRGTVYKNRMPQADIAAHEAAIPLVIFSESF